MQHRRTTRTVVDPLLIDPNEIGSSPVCNLLSWRKSGRVARAVGCISLAALFTAGSCTFPFTVRAAQDAKSPQVPAADSHNEGIGTGSITPASDSLLPLTPLSIALTDGTKPVQTLSTTGHTVAAALDDLKINLTANDKVVPALASPLKSGEQITITRVRVATETMNCPIPFGTVFRMSHDVAPGHITKGHPGKPGILTKTFMSTWTNERLTARKLISKKITTYPINDETLGGIRVRMAQALPSRSGTYRRMRSIDMVATGYSPYEGSGSGRCATGMRAGYGVVAVDPRVIRLGSKLYIEGYGYAVAGDTGGAIKGRRVDLGHTTHREASNVGRRRVRVWVLDPQ